MPFLGKIVLFFEEKTTTLLPKTLWIEYLITQNMRYLNILQYKSIKKNAGAGKTLQSSFKGKVCVYLKELQMVRYVVVLVQKLF